LELYLHKEAKVHNAMCIPIAKQRLSKQASTIESLISKGPDPRLCNESLFVARGSRDRIGELRRILESRQSNVIEEEMARRLHSDL
jgi:hypothetical protein